MKKLIKFLLGSLLSLCAVGAFAGNSAAPEASKDFDCVYSATPNNGTSIRYGTKEVITYTAEEAAANGVPEGYENEVLQLIELGGTSGCGILLDYSEREIPLSAIDGFQFRVYIEYNAGNSNGKPQVRIPQPETTGSWIHQPGSVATPAGEWTTVTVPYAASFSTLCVDGKLDKFELGIRYNAKVDVYIDSVECILKAPTIAYDGMEEISLGLGKALNLPVTATDAFGKSLEVQYVWEDGVALGENGTPAQMGVYALTLKAVDAYGRESEKVLTVNVRENDEVAPVIHVNFDTVNTTVGTKPMLKVTATDNNGEVQVRTAWSQGALDNRGRLTEGVHTWTITATDRYGNVTEKTVTYTVTNDEPAYSYVADEEILVEKYTVTIDGENAMEVSEGLRIQRPADPVREATDEFTYEFLGWYVNDVEWDFENNVITEDTQIVSKWLETKRVYRVYFNGIRYREYIPYGELVPEAAIPSTPTKADTEQYTYVFDGWYLGDKKWDFATDVITGETKLKAQFTEVLRTFTVTFDGENATVYNYGDKVVEPETPTKEDTETIQYVFEGWYNGSAKWDFANDTVKANIDLKAAWKEIAVQPEEDSTSQSSGQDTADGNAGGCMATVSGAIGGMTALGLAALALLKKKEN